MSNVINFKASPVFHEIWKAFNLKTVVGNTPEHVYKLIVEEGSSRSTKTWSNFQVLFLYLYETPISSATILRDTQKSCRDIVEEDWRKWLMDPMVRKKEFERKEIDLNQLDAYLKVENLKQYFVENKTNHTWTFKHNGNMIRFTGLDDENDAMGMTQSVCWINEPYDFSEEVYKQLAQRSKIILFDWNPKQNHWVENEKKKNSTFVNYSTFLDNPFINPESKNQIQSYQPVAYSDAVLSGKLNVEIAFVYDCEANSDNLTAKQRKELSRCQYNEQTNSASEYHWLVYGLGRKSEKPNKIFKGWQVLPEIFDSIDLPNYYGLDFGTAKPTALVEVKCNLVDTVFVKELLYLPINQMPTSLADLLERIIPDKKIPIIADCADPVRISELMSAGFNIVPAHKPSGSVNSGIELIQKCKVFYQGENLSDEYDRYEWEVVKGVNLDRPIKKDDHLLDAFRYCLTYISLFMGFRK